MVGKREGAVVSSVDPEGPAAKAGVKPQDLLLEYNGHKVAGRYPEELFELRRLIADTPVGATVPIRLKRGSSTIDLKLVTTELTTVRSDEVNFEKWGFVGQDITERLALRENLHTTKGVFVTGVRAGAAGEQAGIGKGDVIVRVGEQDVNNAAELRKTYDAAVRAKQAMILLKVHRGLAVVPVVLRITYDEGKKPATPPVKK